MSDINLIKEKTLKKEQEDAVKFLLRRTSAIISLQTGLGKTLSVLTAMQHLKNILSDRMITIIVAPPNALISFERELELFGYSDDNWEEINGIIKKTGKLLSRMVSGENSLLDNYVYFDDIVLVSYSKVEEYIDNLEKLIIQFRKCYKDSKVLIVFDECHTLANPKTTRTKTCKMIAKYCDIKWGLTATPITNDYISVYTLSDFFRPKYIANNKSDFYRKFCEMEKVKRTFYGRTFWQDEIKGMKNEDKLKELLQDLIIRREIKYNIQYKYIPITLTEDELDIYDEVASDRLRQGDTQFSTRCIELQKLLDNCLSVDIYDNEGNPILTKNYKFTTKENKLIDIINWLCNIGHTPIIYTDFIDTVFRLEELLSQNHTVHKIIGKTSTKKRKKVEDTIEQGDIIIITSAGTASLNLQKANTLIFYNVPYSSINVIQSIGRITRLGSSYNKQNVIFLYCNGTIDEYKISYFNSNSARVATLLGSSENLPKEMQQYDNEELTELKQKLLWQYKSKKNKIRRTRKLALKERLIIVNIDELKNNYIETDNLIYNVSGETIEVEKTDKIKIIKSEIDKNYGKALENIKDIGYYKSKLREIFLTDPKILKIYYRITVELKTVILIDNTKYNIGKYIKQYLLENWRKFEEKLQ